MKKNATAFQTIASLAIMLLLAMGLSSPVESQTRAPASVAASKLEKRKIEKPKMQDVLARRDAREVLEANGRIKPKGPHIDPRPVYYVKNLQGQIVEQVAVELPDPEPLVGAAAAPTIHRPPQPSDIGATVSVKGKPYWSTPDDEKDVHQGAGPVCYYIAPIQSLIREAPWIARSFVVKRSDGNGVIYRRNRAAPDMVIVDDLVSAIDCQPNPRTGACAVPLLVKAYAFYRYFDQPAGAPARNTMASTGWGHPSKVFYDFGIKCVNLGAQHSTLKTSMLSALASDAAVVMCTRATTTSGVLVGAHCYSVIGIDSQANTITLRNPWAFDGAGNDADPYDGLITMGWAAFVADTTTVTCTTEYPPEISKPGVVLGDANADGIADFTDFSILSQRFGQRTVRGVSDGDFNRNGVVDFIDFTILTQNWSPLAGDIPAIPQTIPPTIEPLKLDVTVARGGEVSPATIKVKDILKVSWTSNADSVTVTGVLFQSRQTFKAADAFTFMVTAPDTYTIVAVRAADNATVTSTISVPTAAPKPAEKTPVIQLYSDHTWTHTR